MLKRLFSRRRAEELPEELSEEDAQEGAAPPRGPGGLHLGVLWLSAFLASVLVLGAVAFVTWNQLAAQVGSQSDAAAKVAGDRITAEMTARIQGLTDAVERAAAQPALAALIASGDTAAIAARADAIAASLPGAVRVRLLPPGADQTDESQLPRLGYAGLELARQAENGKRPPMELHWPGAADQHLAVARAIAAPQQPPAGVLLAAFDAKPLARWLAAGVPAGAYAELRQSADSQGVVAAGGDAARRAASPSGTAPLPGTSWELVWWLPDQTPLSPATRLLFVAPFGIAALVLGVLFAVLASFDTRLVRADLAHLVTHVFDLLQGRRTQGHTVRLREFRKAVELLDADIHQPARPEGTRPAVPENPLFLPQDTIHVEEVDGTGKPQ